MNPKFSLNSRQTNLLEIISRVGFIETDEAARLFSKTTQTIRRDFELLETHKLLKRVHGGAKAIPEFINKPYNERRSFNTTQKGLMGKLAAAKIPNASCVFLSLGTSTEAVASHLLEHKDMRFVTNNLKIASLLQTVPEAELTICGGRIRMEDGGMLDPRALDVIADQRFDYGVIGVGAINESGDLYSYSFDDSHITKLILKHSKVKILVADDDKLDQNANYKICNISDVDIFVTGTNVSTKIAELCQLGDVELILADSP